MAHAKSSKGQQTTAPGNKWTKGMASPNPKGRPPTRKKQDLFKQIDPLAAAFIAHDTRTLSKREGDRIERVERGEAAIEKLYKEAMSGDVAALKYYLDLRDAAYRHRNEMHEAMLAAAIKWHERYLTQFDYAERLGKPVPDVLPHPRDVVINPDGSVSILGPVTLLEQENLRELLKVRAQLKRSFLLALEHQEYEGMPEKLKEFRKAWSELNKAIPPRLQQDFPSLE